MADRDLLALLHGALDRTTTFTAECRCWRHLSRSNRAFEVARIVSPSPIGTMLHNVGGPDVADESEMVWRVVETSGGRSRWDPVSERGAYAGHVPPGRQGCDGERSWHVGNDSVYISRAHTSALVQRLLDPVWVLTHDLEVVGEESMSGRAVLQVRAVARPGRSRSGGAADMAAERDLRVDAERGFLHRDTALVDSQPYDEMALRDIVVDNPVDPSMFAVEIPTGFNVFDSSADSPPPFPWARHRRWHVQWPFSRW